MFLFSEIKRIDSKLQNLVYENYRKFIVASDTIHQMKSHVADMEEQMNALTESVEKIHVSSGLVDVHLGDRRQKLETLTGVSSLIHKVCLLCFYFIYFINNFII